MVFWIRNHEIIFNQAKSPILGLIGRAIVVRKITFVGPNKQQCLFPAGYRPERRRLRYAFWTQYECTEDKSTGKTRRSAN